jgi:uncharacterized membrane protein YgcG
MAEQQPRKLTGINVKKLALSAKNTDGGNASLNWEFQGNNPGIIVWTGLKGDTKPIRAALDSRTFMAMLVLLKEASNFIPTPEKPKFAYHIECNRPNWKPGGGKPEGTVTEARLTIGKDDKGCVYIAISAHQRESVKFVFGMIEYPWVFHRLLHPTGESLSQAEVSVPLAKAYVKMLEVLIPYMMIHNYDDEAEQKARGGNKPNNNNGSNNNRGGYSGGGNNGGGNSGGGGNQSANIPDDDFPF